jgi:hypothetical protein
MASWRPQTPLHREEEHEAEDGILVMAVQSWAADLGWPTRDDGNRRKDGGRRQAGRQHRHARRDRRVPWTKHSNDDEDQDGTQEPHYACLERPSALLLGAIRPVRKRVHEDAPRSDQKGTA